MGDLFFLSPFTSLRHINTTSTAEKQLSELRQWGLNKTVHTLIYDKDIGPLVDYMMVYHRYSAAGGYPGLSDMLYK